MKLIKLAPVLIGVGLALTACGGTDKTSASPTLPPAPADSSTSAAVDDETNPQACGSTDYRKQHAEYCDSVDPVVKTNDRGNVEVALGAPIPLSDGGTFTIDKIEKLTAACPEDDDYSKHVPQNGGSFVRLDIRAATAPASTVGTVNQASISGSDFKEIKTDGLTFNGDLGSFDAYACLKTDQRFPEGALGPGQQFVGSIVLDVPDTAGTLLYSGGGFITAQGYEIKLPG